MRASTDGSGCDRTAMLSLAKLAAGQGASYWLQQAQGPVTHAQSVSSGVEDYYLSGPEATGCWTGSGACGLELAGDVEPEALTRMLDRKDPRTGDALPRPAGRAPTVPGFDLMFSVPKSASMLFGLGGEREQGAVFAGSADRRRRGDALSRRPRRAGSPR
jgi:conjugative relaxase-like TrwC/TraI family protein